MPESFLIKLLTEACSFIKKRDPGTGTGPGLFSCELYDVFKNNFFTEHLL